MAASFVQLPDDGSNAGKKVRTQTAVVGVDTVHTHYMILSDEAGNAITTLPVSGTVTANVGTGTQPVSGSVSVSNFPATQPVSGTVTAAAQPGVDIGDVTINNAAGASAVNVQDGGNSLTVDGTVAVSNFPATQPVSGTVTANAGTGTLAVSVASTLAVSPGNATGKTNVMKTGTLASTATTADQVILTYTVTAGKTFYAEYLEIQARLTTYAATATLFGTASLETPSGTKVLTRDIFHTGTGDGAVFTFPEPIPVAAGVVIRVVCTPSATTAFTWRANFGGYEK